MVSQTNSLVFSTVYLFHIYEYSLSGGGWASCLAVIIMTEDSLTLNVCTCEFNWLQLSTQTCTQVAFSEKGRVVSCFILIYITFYKLKRCAVCLFNFEPLLCWGICYFVSKIQICLHLWTFFVKGRTGFVLGCLTDDNLTLNVYICEFIGFHLLTQFCTQVAFSEKGRVVSCFILIYITSYKLKWCAICLFNFEPLLCWRICYFISKIQIYLHLWAFFVKGRTGFVLGCHFYDE